jgi:predicted small lipoprotein YifL
MDDFAARNGYGSPGQRRMRRRSEAGMRNGTHVVWTALALALAASTLGGCGRKNLPVAPREAASPGETERNSPANLENFRRSNRVTSGGGADLRITPAEVSGNPGASKRPFVLDGLLN